jgi:prevent-host-death family protein
VETVGSFEAKTHLSVLLERVAKGERFTITKHGVPVAMLVPMKGSDKQDRKEVVRRIEEFGKGRSLKGLTIRKLIDEGRRL